MKSKPFRSFNHCIKYSYFTPLHIPAVKIIAPMSTLLDANTVISCCVSVYVCGCGFPLLAPGSSPNLQFISSSSLRLKNLGWLCAHCQITQSASSWQIHFLWEISLRSIVAVWKWFSCLCIFLCILALAPACALISSTEEPLAAVQPKPPPGGHFHNLQSSSASLQSTTAPTTLPWPSQFVCSRLTCVCFLVQ